MTSSRDDAPPLSSERLDRSLRLRRLRFPRIRPRGGPHGYLDGLGWLGDGLLWIDGWLTLPPVDSLEIGFEIAGTPLRRSAACFTYPRTPHPSRPDLRRWILAVPVGAGFGTTSRVRRIALGTPWGDLLWHGGYDRFITPDVVDRLRDPILPSHLLTRLDPFLEAVVRGHGEDPAGPTFRRNLEALRRRLELDAEPGPRSDALRRGFHVEEALACPGGLLYLSVLLESRERVSLVARTVRDPRAEPPPALDDCDGAGSAPPDFLTAIALEAGGCPGTVRYCLHGEVDGAAWTPIAAAQIPALELRERIVERLGARSSLPPRAIELLHAVSLAASTECEVARRRVVGSPPAKPRASVVVTALERPDLLDHHLLYLHRSLVEDLYEVILVVGAGAADGDLVDRVEGLAELYDLPVTLLQLTQDTVWSSAAEIGARNARGEILLLVHGHSLGFAPSGAATLVEAFERNQSIGIAAPTVVHFDGAVRSAGLRIGDLREGGSTSIRPISLPNGNGSNQTVRIEACSADCFAVRRQLFSALGGFSGLFLDQDFEAIDLCLRAAAAGFETVRVPATFTRLVGEDFRGLAQPRTPARHHDLETLGRRHRGRSGHLGVAPVAGVRAVGQEERVAAAEEMVAGVERLVQ